MSNPLLTFTDLPPFSQIKPEHIKPAVEQAIADCRAKVEEVLKDNTNPTWENVIAPLEEIDDRLSRIWSPVGHMNSVVNSEALREAYESCLPILSEYGTWVGQQRPVRSVQNHQSERRICNANACPAENHHRCAT